MPSIAVGCYSSGGSLKCSILIRCLLLWTASTAAALACASPFASGGGCCFRYRNWRNPCENATCPNNALCVPAVNVDNLYRCVCPNTCWNVGDSEDSGEVCGSDGRTYPSLCHLMRASCHAVYQVKAMYRGRCNPCADFRCPSGQRCGLDANRKPRCECEPCRTDRMGNDKNSIKDNTSINKDTSASSVAANSAKKCGRPKKKNWSRSKNNIKVAAVGDLTAGEEQIQEPDVQPEAAAASSIAAAGTKAGASADAAAKTESVIKLDEAGLAALLAEHDAALADALAASEYPVVEGDAEVPNSGAAYNEQLIGYLSADETGATAMDFAEGHVTAAVQVQPVWVPFSSCRVENVRGDGNCFFTAILRQLQELPGFSAYQSLSVEDFRDAVAAEFEQWVHRDVNNQERIMQTGLNWEKVRDDTRRPRMYVPCGVPELIGELLRLEVFIYQSNMLNLARPGHYSRPNIGERLATIRLLFNPGSQHYEIVRVNDLEVNEASSVRPTGQGDLSAKNVEMPPLNENVHVVEDPVVMMPPPAPPMTPFEKVADWTRVQSRHWKGRCRNQAKSLENNTSLFAHPNSYEVLRDRNNSVWNWNVDLDAEDSAESVEIEHVSESVKSDRVSESVPSNVPRRSRRKKDVGKASCATRRSSRLSAKANTLESVSVAASSVSGQSLLRRSSRTRRAPCCSCIGCGDSVSAVSSVSCHLEKGRGREKKSDVVPSAPTRRSERLKNQQQVVNYANSLPRKQRLTNAENHICEPVRSSPRKTAPLQQEQQDKRQSDNIPATSTYSSPRKTRATQEKPDEAIRSSPRKRPTMEQQPAKENVPQSSTSEESAQDAPIVEDEIGDPNLPKCLRNPFTDQFKKMRQDFFNENITKVSHLKQCYVCREKFPGKYFSIDSEDMCDRCFRDDNEPKSFSQENNAIPMLEQPEDLQDLSVAEQMLISPVLSVIVVVQIFPKSKQNREDTESCCLKISRTFCESCQDDLCQLF
ncbi:hypothetical protein BOX15_Mlig009437g1 [Macrostomum lignano]|uniref:OTU domain-containing protein n=1 Tax=Macrostomum lignano TaxID=282301 RepID=A0A267FM19_9PLAT|nr:hypothetical protein BOX15_Mlig009437g1 [Macrostomum lignano]